MSIEYRIHPSIGVARLGNSDEIDTFYLSPVKIGGRPIECNRYGDELCEKDRGTIEWYNIPKDERKQKFVKKFKDKHKKVRKQAAKFRIFRHDPAKPQPEEVDLTDKSQIKNVKWTVHLANKKASWYHFTEFTGDLMLGDKNTYTNRQDKKDADLRNKDIEGKHARKDLIIDFGPRSLDLPCSRIHFKNDHTVPYGYSSTSPLHQRDHYPAYGKRIDYLGEIITDSKNNLVVLGGHGNSGGDEPFDSFAGGDSWYDDISDGPIYCEIELADGTKLPPLDAWVIVGPPKFAPELVNITTLDDLMLDIAVKHFGKDLGIYDETNPKFVDENGKNKGWNPKYKANFKRDIEPIIKRIGHYRWVANVPSMMDFCMPHFDLTDNSPANLENRRRYFEYFRNSDETYWGIGGRSEQLFSTFEKTENNYINGIPLMPLNAGSNAVSNKVPDKFVELSRTQQFFLEQWAKGEFTTGEADDVLRMLELDHADVGNCVGNPMCPGVEVTWSVKNPATYAGPYRIKHRNVIPQTGKIDLKFYFKDGLDPEWDETAPKGEHGKGCEPGDLTKRMADPWVSDLFECNVNNINFTDSDEVMDKSEEIAAPPTYYSYWWPPQSPWDVIVGITDPDEIKMTDSEATKAEKRKQKAIEELEVAGVSAGQQVNYIRGIHNHIEMAYAWSYLGFIVNQNEGNDRDQYPYFVEKERNHEEFQVSAVVAANKIHYLTNYNINLLLGWYLKKDILDFTKSEGTLRIL